MRGQGFFVVMNHVINPVVAGVLRSPEFRFAEPRLALTRKGEVFAYESGQQSPLRDPQSVPSMGKRDSDRSSVELPVFVQKAAVVPVAGTWEDALDEGLK